MLFSDDVMVIMMVVMVVMMIAKVVMMVAMVMMMNGDDGFKIITGSSRKSTLSNFYCV